VKDEVAKFGDSKFRLFTKVLEDIEEGNVVRKDEACVVDPTK